jgi:biotin synthase
VSTTLHASRHRLTCRMPAHPESFPVNTLVPIEGTPLEKNDVSELRDSLPESKLMRQPVEVHTVLRTIATARIVLPRSIIRLAAGRHTFSETEQAMVRYLLHLGWMA